MDTRQKRRLEEETDQAIRKIDKEIERLNEYYTRAKRASDNIVERGHRFYTGDAREFMKIIDKSSQNLADFERKLEHRRRNFEEEKRKIRRAFDKKTRDR
ncbi:hypothetical protein [Lactovum odontotermitis]